MRPDPDPEFQPEPGPEPAPEPVAGTERPPGETPDRTSGPMRPVFTCVICGCVYMPPRTMTYPLLGTTASPLHCGEPTCRRAAARIPRALRRLYAEGAWTRARKWMDKEPSDAVVDARRRSRASTRPEGSRSKLR
ncbi:hypothetical protein M1P56_14505 [Streptomyces sp. HU2014]|uniref:Uncharacterized protein n=1 Tax=Streptomyces albireticuli TaxID=1940 RepID=A0A1Z2LD06_9ACTN|nr:MULTISPECIES: hypothetical protein [Streptomyces]ARZ72091.1 hypothetical protein SMD11_6515 [Streptomyces albireticuli]UQI45474.1 hypothetical protein M1P56_14505 [Streptomyces sp. HU2014]